MTISLPLKNVSSIGHVSLSVNLAPDGVVQLETYSGTLAIGSEEHSGNTYREQFQIFLPIKDTTIGTYEGSSILESAVMVAPGGFTGDDDETNTCSIEDFFVDLEQQTLPGIGGNPPCLVLLFSIALLNGVLHRVSYTVTLTMKPTSKGSQEDVGPDAKPA